jgi:LysM repeat protein
LAVIYKADPSKEGDIMSDVTISIRVDDDLYERAKVRAQGQGHTVESILAKLLTDWVGPPPAQPPVPPPEPVPEPEPAYQTYTVKAGDTLGKIAKEFYGDATKYSIIAEYNGLEDPSRIFIGQVLRIPPLTPPIPGPPPTPVEPPTWEDLNISWIPSPNFNERPDPDDITTIVVHATANSTLVGVVSWFQNTTAYVSAHYVIDKDGKMVQMVKDEDRAWHAGKSEWRGVPSVNDYGLGICARLWSTSTTSRQRTSWGTITSRQDARPIPEVSTLASCARM